MVILGIDPGSRFTGWGIVEHAGSRTTYRASGVFRLGSERPLADRLLTLSREMDAMLEAHQPEQCAIEQIFTARNARSALVLGHARGVILATLAARGVIIAEYSATQIKQSVVGKGRASKDQVQQMVAVLLGRREKMMEDEADALAVALTHGVNRNLARRLT